MRAAFIRFLFFAAAAAAVAGVGYGYYAGYGGAPGGAPGACTLEAKLCPDGSSVGRIGPHCEFAPCPGTAAPPPAAHSGIRGAVMLGPTCPVERIPPDPRCADKPYQTLVVVFRRDDPARPVALTKSGADGAFSFSLPPGGYILGAGEKMLPRCVRPEVTVLPGAYASTTIECDTGIR